MIKTWAELQLNPFLASDRFTYYILVSRTSTTRLDDQADEV